MSSVLMILYDLMFFVFFGKPAAVEGISLRDSCFDGGTNNVRVGCG
jgi:hypothetical protein